MLWMRNGVVLRKQIAARDIQISPVNEAVVALHEVGAIGPVVTGQIEPGQGWRGVMCDVQVAVEEEKAEQRRFLYDRGAMRRVGGRPMLCEGSNQRQAQPRIDEEPDVGGER